MVEPRPPRRVDSFELHKLNAAVAAKQTFASPIAEPNLAVRPASLPGRRPAAKPLRGPRLKRRPVATATLSLLLVGGGALAFSIYSQLHNKFSAASIVISTAKAAATQAVPLQGQGQGRTNFLIYGMTKDGLRTDSIMLASYYYQQKKLVTLNIPRDLEVYDGYEHVKFGEVYAYAKLRQPKNQQYPDQFVSQLVAKEYGIPVNYWVELNMQGEVSLINDIGGVDVTVANSFTDYEYPTWDYSGYIRPAPSFKAGPQHMNGDTALIFSRSRHSLDSNEGSDFARSKRQALVLQAIMTKVKAQGILGNLSELSKYLGLVNQNVATNMSTDEMVAAGLLGKNLSPATDHLIANWSTTNGFLCDSTSAAGAYITLYGTKGSCTTEAGGKQDSPYRDKAIAYVQNLLQSASPPPAAPAAAAPRTSPSNFQIQ